MPTFPSPSPGELPAPRRGNRARSREVQLRRVLATTAAAQHGIVTRRQLVALGFSRDAVRRLVRSERVFTVHPGIYHVGHPRPTRLGAHLAAAWAFGWPAGVSHRPAVALRGIVPDTGAVIQVSTASADGGHRRGVRVHESRRLAATDLTRVQGVPAVRLERALIEVAGSCSADEFARVFNAMDRKRLVDPLLLAGQLRRGRTGSAAVRARLELYTEQPPTESELEEAFLETVVRAHGLPEPVRQASPLPARAMRVDFTWPGPCVLVEIDGRTWHAIQETWGEDHQRDLALRLAGWRPLRYTHHQLARTPDLVAADLAAALRFAA